MRRAALITGEKILITGASGNLGLQFGRFLAAGNDVWGLARLADPRARQAVRDAGMTPIAIDLGGGDLGALPADFTLVLHFSHTRRGADEFVEAIQINAIGAGLVLQHCRSARAALVISSTAVYSPPADVFTPLAETGAIGRAWAPWAPSSPVSKVSLEAVARFAAEAFRLPVTIARLNSYYGPEGGLPVMDMQSIVEGRPVHSFADPYPHSPIHIDDMLDQLGTMIDAASIPATIVNWGGDEAVTQRRWCELAADYSGRPAELIVAPIPGTPNGNVSDSARRRTITGPCTRAFEPSFRAIYEARFAEPGR